jgi:hypothetical protein
LEEGQQLEQRNQQLVAENARLKQLAESSPFHDPDKVAQFAALAQAEGVSLPVARRLLTILQANSKRRR